MNIKTKRGFTLLEILLVIAAVGILAAIVLVAINPNRQIESARAAKRKADINTIIKSIGQWSIDNNGQYPSGIETGAKVICPSSNPPVGCVDLSILSPDYIAAIPEPDTGYYYVRRNIGGTSIEVTHPKDSIWDTGGTPSLDLNFTSNKSLIDNVSGNNLITFTRGSTGTYVGEDGLIKTAAINEPRFDHNPITGESLGLLVEEQRTNLVFPSAANSAWTADIITPNAPNFNLGSNALGVFPGVLVPSNGQAWHTIRVMGINLISPNTYTYTIFYRAGTSGRLRFTIRNNSNSTESLVNGLVGNLSVSSQAAGTMNIVRQELLGDGLTYKLTGTFIPNTTGADYWVRIGPDSFTSGENVIALGAQLEQGSFATSYIPTTTSTVTRNAETVTIAGSNFSSGWYNTSQGTIFARGISNNTTSNIGLMAINDSSGTNRIDMRITSHNGFITTGGVDQFVSNSSTYQRGTHSNMGLAWVSGSSALSVNSNTPSIGNPGTIPSLVSRMILGQVDAGSAWLNGTISRITYWPTRLPNATLQSITQ